MLRQAAFAALDVYQKSNYAQKLLWRLREQTPATQASAWFTHAFKGRSVRLSISSLRVHSLRRALAFLA